MSTWKDALNEAKATLNRFMADEELLQNCEKMSRELIDCFNRDGNLFTCGNGGSHCDAMHFAEELTGKFRNERPPLGALALGDASHITCVGNDYGFEDIFARQLEGLSRKGDVLVALSTSGNSENVCRAVFVAKKVGLTTIGLLGRDGGKLKDMVDIPIVVPAEISDRIQEMHIKIIHTAIESVERELFPENYKS